MTFKDGDPTNIFGTIRVAQSKIKNEIQELEEKKDVLQKKSRQLAIVQSAAEGLRRDWRCSLAGHGQSNAWFFVRSFELDEARKPINYDPFWAREWIDDLAKAEVKAPLITRVKSSPAYFSGHNILGSFTEASRTSCPECGEESCVVGDKELAYWGDPRYARWRVSLYVFCVKCPRLTRFAHRQDE